MKKPLQEWTEELEKVAREEERRLETRERRTGEEDILFFMFLFILHVLI